MQPESLYRLTMSALDRIKNQLTIFHTSRVGLDFLFQRHYQRLLYRWGACRDRKIKAVPFFFSPLKNNQQRPHATPARRGRDPIFRN